MSDLDDLDRLLARPDEPEEKDAVVRFWVQWEGSPKTYSFVAIKFSTGLWTVTGADAQGRTWSDMLDWMDRRGGEVTAMEHATAWEKML